MSNCMIREWKIEDKYNLAALLNNKNILNNLRDGLPYPYTVKNTASSQVLEKAGFQLEGILHSNAVKNGIILDMKLYALIKEDK